MVGFKFSGFLKEEHGQPLFGVQFNPYLNASIFATVGSNRVTIYQCDPEDNVVSAIQGYQDADSEENFYTCVWSYIEKNKVCLLIAAGVKGIIRVIDTDAMQCILSFKGHGNAVNELKIHPRDPSILLSASKDYAIRIWNLQTAVCVAILGGVKGHRDEVLSADFSLDGRYVLSAGMDHALKLWDLSEESVEKAMERSYQYRKGDDKSFPVAQIQFPLSSSRDIHRNYIDCVRWYGQLAMSKSCENSISLWQPSISDNQQTESESKSSSIDVMHRFDAPNCEIWFIRFTLDRKLQYMATGNQIGKVLVWDLTMDDITKAKPLTLSHSKCVSPIRQVSFNNDGSILVGVCDSGCIWRWDRK